MRRFLLLLAACCGLIGTLGAPSALEGDEALHPQDGPDVDVRIRIEDDVVRATLVFNLAFLDELFGVLREDEYNLHPIEYEDLHAELFPYLRDELRISIDDVEVTPLDKGFEVADADPTLLPLFPAFGAKALIKARIVLEYPAKSPPQRVAIVWPAFPPDYVLSSPDGTPPVEVNAQIFAGGVDSLVVFRADEPEYTWHATEETYADRFLEVPAPGTVEHRSLPALSIALALLGVGIALVGFLVPAGRRHWRAGAVVVVLLGGTAAATTGVGRLELAGRDTLPDQEQALAIFLPLHANIYRAFDYTDESDVYDALAQSVHGDLLDRLYNEIYRGLVMQEEGGAVARVQAVTPLETTIRSIGLLPPDDAPGFSVVARWQVEGAVFHWGHSHFRTNEYEAQYNVLATDTGWRIADSQILEQRRVDSSPLTPGSGPVFPTSTGDVSEEEF